MATSEALSTYHQSTLQSTTELDSTDSSSILSLDSTAKPEGPQVTVRSEFPTKQSSLREAIIYLTPWACLLLLLFFVSLFVCYYRNLYQAERTRRILKHHASVYYPVPANDNQEPAPPLLDPANNLHAALRGQVREEVEAEPQASSNVLSTFQRFATINPLHRFRSRVEPISPVPGPSGSQSEFTTISLE